MNTKCNDAFSRLQHLLPVLLLAMAGMSGMAQAKDFTPPDLEGFNLHDERDADGDGDGENETRLHQYLNANGDSLVSFTTNGRLWAWSLDTRNDNVGPRNYVIRDSNCDGTFDEVYGLDDEFHVPDCTR
jgi:hypothetical protein